MQSRQREKNEQVGWVTEKRAVCSVGACGGFVKKMIFVTGLDYRPSMFAGWVYAYRNCMRACARTSEGYIVEV